MAIKNNITSYHFLKIKTDYQILIISFFVALFFSIRYINCLPFSGFTREFNYETIVTLLSYFIYASEDWKFPIGLISSFTYPFLDANIGNVAGLPLFGIIFKALGLFSKYFLEFDYFILVEILASFFTAYFSQKILLKIGVCKLKFLIFGGFITGTSLLLLNRSVWMQPFCIVSGPIYLAWVLVILLVLEKKDFIIKKLLKYAIVFPVAVLLDGYSFFGVVLASFAFIVALSYEAYFAESKNSIVKFKNLILFTLTGILLSYLVLFIIGMYPMPNITNRFTSYDFGMGGRYHVADLFSPFMPQGGIKFSGMINSLPSLIPNFLFTTDLLSDGQYEGIAYVGTPILLILILAFFSLFFPQLRTRTRSRTHKLAYRLNLTSNWTKVCIASITVFIFSLGYELHILGYGFKSFNLMPAALIADIFPSLYTVRATGRLAIFLSFFLTLEAIRIFSVWSDGLERVNKIINRNRLLSLSPTKIYFCILFASVLHVVEIFPFLKPVSAQTIQLLDGRFSEEDVKTIRQLSKDKSLVMIAPSVRAVELEWEAYAYGFVLYSRLKSNLYYIARTDREHDLVIAKDLDSVEKGDWEYLENKYEEQILFVIPTKLSDKIRSKVSQNYQEVLIKSISIWKKNTLESNN